jgi:hypothetical protein
MILSLTAMASQAQTTKVLIDNDKIKVTEYTSQPGQDVCGKGQHTHGDHATVLLTDATVKTTTADGAIQTETWSADKHLYTVTENGKTQKISADGGFWVKGVTHSVINAGRKPMRFYIIETK